MPCARERAGVGGASAGAGSLLFMKLDSDSDLGTWMDGLMWSGGCGEKDVCSCDV